MRGNDMAGKKGMRKKLPKLAQQHNQKLGSMNIMKGSDSKGEVTYSWDVVQKCRFEQCPAATHCHYISELTEGDDCRIMKKYMRAASLVLYAAQSEMTSIQRYQVGMHIIPLYKTLCKMKIEEVGIVDAVTLTSRGTMQVNPIYKEMREIIKVIDQVWKSIGLRGGAVEAPKFGEGQTNYYDAMEAEAFAAMGDKVTPIRKK